MLAVVMDQIAGHRAASDLAPNHPRTQGKVERFHQTLKRWLGQRPAARFLAELQAQLDTFRHAYDEERPHRARPKALPAGPRALAVIDEREVTVVALETGEVLSSHRIGPERSYRRNQRRNHSMHSGARTYVVASELSTNEHNAEIRFISSTVRARLSSRASVQTMQATHRARLMATLGPFLEKRKSAVHGMDSADDVVIE